MHEYMRFVGGAVFLVALVALSAFIRRKRQQALRERALFDETTIALVGQAARVLADEEQRRIVAAAAAADWTDRRPIESMTFGMNEKTAEAREATAVRVRQLLKWYGCTTADDITKLGCTGIAELHAAQGRLAQTPLIDTVTQIRLGLAGSGVGLPCFVPPTRFCLGHNTIGGLQEGQTPLHAEFVNDVSRELTPEETARVIVVEKARRVQPGSASPETTQHAADLLAGRKRAEVVDAFRDFTHDVGENQIVDLDAEESDAEFPRLGATTEWVCVEHKEPRWECRYCVAQLIVEGELVPEFVVDVEGAALRMDSLLPEELAVRLQQESAPVTVFVRAKTITKGPTT